MIKTPGKKQRVTNYENKRFTEEVKKKGQFEKITKIRERNGAVTNQIVNRKTVEKDKEKDRIDNVKNNGNGNFAYESVTKKGVQQVGITNIVLGSENSQNRRVTLDIAKFGIGNGSSPAKKTLIRFNAKRK